MTDLPARALLEALPPEQWEGAAREVLEQAFAQGERVYISCSGGADSVALLWLVALVYPNQLGHCVVLHYDHRTRGGVSSEDARFVGKLCDELGMRCVLGRREEVGDASEASLREGRMGFFHACMQEAEARVLLTAHHRDDVAESLLMRQLRGSGLEGLAAPRAVQHYGDFLHLRPLLPFSKYQILTALGRAGVEWREDSSNAEDDYLRNRIRHHVIPELNRLGERDFSVGAARTRRLVEEGQEAVRVFSLEKFPDVEAVERFPVASCADLPRAVVRDALERWFVGQGVRAQVESALMDKLLEVLGRQEAGSFTLSEGLRLVWAAGALEIQAVEAVREVKEWSPCVLIEGVRWFLPSGDSVGMELVKLDAARRKAILEGKVSPQSEVWLAAEALACPLYMRNLRAGDRYRPLGAPGSRKLSDLFIDRKIPRHQRGELAVITDKAGEVLVCQGFAPAHCARVRKNTQSALWLTWQGKSSRVIDSK